MNEVQEPDRVPMSRRERDVLAVLRGVSSGERTQVEAARLLKKSVRQIRRMQRAMEATGDAALVHGLRGRPSNHRHDPSLRKRVLATYRREYADFGPTFAVEKLADDGSVVGVETLRRWLLAEGLWTRRRHRDPHRSRRPRRGCFGEPVQMDASIHDWLEGRGETVVLITMIDDATSRVLARFYPAGTVEAHMDLLERWLRTYGRPLALYTDRHGIFEVHEKGQPLADPDAVTQFGRALGELDIALIRAHSPQAKGRVERSFGTAQDRWVKELRLAKARTCAAANAVLDGLLPKHNRRFAVAPRVTTDGHRALGRGFDLGSILSVWHERVVSNDYVVRWAHRHYQLLPPAVPGLRGGRVVIEERRDGGVVMRFGTHRLRYREIDAKKDDEAGEGRERETGERTRRRRPSGSGPYKPAADHPWRNGGKK